MSKKDEDKINVRPGHIGSTSAEDEELSLWINRLWSRNEIPERLELWQMVGPGKAVRGEMIFHEDFRPNEKRTIEEANKLANELIAAAQHDCDCSSSKKEASYGIVIIDKNRRSTPLVRRLGPLQPKHAFALRTLQQADKEVDDEDNLDLHVLDLRRVKEANDQIRWEKSRNDRIVEGMLLLQDNIIKTQQVTIDRLADKIVQGVERTQDALDRGNQREMLIEEKRFNLGMKKELMRTARNLLPGFFGGGGDSGSAPAPTNGHSNNHPNAAPTQPAPLDMYGKSPERILVENFLNDVGEDQLAVTLFGDYKEEHGNLVQIKEGIFYEEQLKILLGVRAGHMPASRLDELVPDWGHKNAVTFDQIKKAGNAGLSEAVGFALLEVVNLRKQARAAAEAVSTSSTPPNDSPTLS